VKPDRKSLLLGIVIGIAIGVFLSIVLIAVIPSFMQSNTQSKVSVNQLKVLANQVASTNVNGINYWFKYMPTSNAIRYGYENNGGGIQSSFSDQVGTQINMLGIQVTVSEIYSAYVILSIKMH
jgi:hypothetical protein